MSFSYQIHIGTISIVWRINLAVERKLIILITKRFNMVVKKVNLNQKFNSFSEYWSPKIIGALNGQLVKIAKVQGEFIMHNHENEDELFFVVEGTLYIEMKDQTIQLNQGEMVVIPKGVNHKPYAPQEVKILLFEPAITLNTGNIENEQTVKNLEEI